MVFPTENVQKGVPPQLVDENNRLITMDNSDFTKQKRWDVIVRKSILIVGSIICTTWFIYDVFSYIGPLTSSVVVVGQRNSSV